jgi:hypothetical protein
MVGDRNCRGIVSWKTIGKRIAFGESPQYVRDCTEAAVIRNSDDSVFDIAADVYRFDVVLIRASDQRIQGIVTTSDITLLLGTLLEPFLLVGEIENHIRLLLDKKLPPEVIKSARDPEDTKREIHSAANLTFGEYQMLLQKDENWSRLGLPLSRKAVNAALDSVREIRNDVMHFNPEGIGGQRLQSLREFALFMREISRRV